MAPPGFGHIDFMGRVPIPVLESLPFTLLLATVLGFLSGMGVGGGSLLILWLTIVLKVSAETARGINLLFFIPSALISCCFRWKQGSLPRKTVLPAVFSGCIAAAFFSWFGTKLDTGLLKKLFGGLLLITGLRELLYRPKKPQRP